jgi:type I restriction enzyme R subunit
MATKDRLQSGNGNALLVAGSIYEACKYYELFQDTDFTQCAIITSYKPTSQDIKGETSGEGFTEKLRQYETYNKMLNGKTPEAFEIEVKNKFIEEPEQMKLLIVVDKLLTGFDAPSATYLYIDKTMGDHGLFQAICRVNRLDGEDKIYGYIVDYKDLFRSLDKAISDYTSEAFEDYDAEDIKGLLNDRLDEAKENLDNALEIVKALCEPVKYPQDTAAHISYFCGNPEIADDLKNTAPRRTLLYKFVAHLIRAYAQIANEMSSAGYTPQETTQMKAAVRHFENVRQEIKLASGDYIDLKMYESAMRHLIDTYIRAEESEKISAFDDLTLVQMIVDNAPDAVDRLLPNIRNNPAAVAATINNNLRVIITEEQPNNPKYYEQMSVLLEEIIELRRQEAINYEEYLQKIAELCQQVTNPNESSHYPPSLDTNAKRTLYDNLAQNEELARQLDQSIRQTKKDGWRGNKIKEREVKYAISEHLLEESEVDSIFTIVRNQSDY